MKRTVSTFVLLAFVLAGAAPCAAANMSCGMKMPSPDERCASCAPEGGNGPILKAASCCSFEPGQDRSAAPAVLSASTGSSPAPLKASPAISPAATTALAGALHPLSRALHGATGPPASTAHSTVLRL